MSKDALAGIESVNRLLPSVAAKLHTRRNQCSAFGCAKGGRLLAVSLVVLGTCFVRVPHSHAETCQEEKLRVEAANPDTTIVCEDRPTSGGADPGTVPNSTDTDTGTETTHRPAGGGGSHPTSPRQHFIPGMLALEDFQFKDTQEGANSQQTKCIPVRFESPVFGVSQIGIRISVGKQLRDGRVISPEEAQRISHTVATKVAADLIKGLNNGPFKPVNVAGQYVIYLRDAFIAQGDGYRVAKCAF